MIVTKFELQEDRVAFFRPEFKEGAQTLVSSNACLVDGEVNLAYIETAIRKAYFMGRQDRTREVSAVLGSLIGAA